MIHVKKSVISAVCLWLILSRLGKVKPNFLFALTAPDYLCDIKNSTILLFYTEKCVSLYATREMMTRGSLRKPSKIRIYMMPVNNYMAPSPQPVIANDSIK